MRPDVESPQTVLRTDVPEPQKLERLRFSLSPLFPLLARKASEPDQPGFVFVQFQSVLRQPALQLLQVAPRFALVLEPNDGIIGVAHEDHVALRVLPPLDCPQVEYIVQIYVC
jgi:hypothetical protein